MNISSFRKIGKGVDRHFKSSNDCEVVVIYNLHVSGIKRFGHVVVRSLL